jgi:hypothetical protein
MNALVVPLTTQLGVVGLIAVMYMLYILANLSRRLGAVTKMKPYYRGFYGAMGFLAISLLARMTFSSVALSPEPSASLPIMLFITLVVYHLPFVIAMAISAVVAWRYWSWLFKEKLR